MPIIFRGRLTSLLLCLLGIVLAAEAAAMPIDMESKTAQGGLLPINKCEFHVSAIVQCQEGIHWADMCLASPDQPCKDAFCYPIVRYIVLGIFMSITLITILVSLWQ